MAELGGDVARFFNTVLDRVGLDQVGDARRGCSAHVTDGAAVINLVLVIEAGHPVPEVTDAVRMGVAWPSRRTAFGSTRSTSGSTTWRWAHPRLRRSDLSAHRWVP